jgi:amino acid transporter
VIFISVVSTGSISGYGGSRMLMGLAHVKMNHKVYILAYATSERPVSRLPY